MKKFLILFTLILTAKENIYAAAASTADESERGIMSKKETETHNVFGTNFTYEMENTAEESKTGAPIWADEYGVVVLIKGPVSERAEAFSKALGSADITPHITLGQGRYPGDKLGTLESKVAELASTTSPAEITFADHLVKHGSGNTFWNITDNTAVNEWNKALCELLEPGFTEPMWQVATDETADKESVLRYGRGFNIPGNNNPHITVAYGKQNDGIIEGIKEELGGENMAYIPTGFAITKIDSVGNIVEIVKEIPFSL